MKQINLRLIRSTLPVEFPFTATFIKITSRTSWSTRFTTTTTTWLSTTLVTTLKSISIVSTRSILTFPITTPFEQSGTRIKKRSNRLLSSGPLDCLSSRFRLLLRSSLFSLLNLLYVLSLSGLPPSVLVRC